MDSSKSSTASLSASEHESYSDVEVLSSKKRAGYTQSRTRTTARFIMADEGLNQKSTGQFLSVQKNFAITPSRSQFFMDSNSYINNAFPYYNERAAKQFMPVQNFHRFPQPYRQNVEFSAFQAQQQQQRHNMQPDFYIPRYVPRPQGFAASTRVRETHMAKSAGPLPGYMPNSNRSRVFAVVDSYGSHYNINYPPGTGPNQFYANQAFDGSQMNVNQPDGMDLPRTPILEKKNNMSADNLETQSLSQNSHNEEVLSPLSANWGVPGGFGNTFNSQKYYREQDADEKPFYPLEFGVKDISSPRRIGRCTRKCKMATVFTLLGCFILLIVAACVTAGVFRNGRIARLSFNFLTLF